MRTPYLVPPPAGTTAPIWPATSGFLTLYARLLARAVARVGDHDAAEDLVQETLITAWERGVRVAASDLDQLLIKHCRCWQARRQARRSALHRLAMAGSPPSPWLLGPTLTAADSAAIVELVLLRVAIVERLRRPATGGAGSAAGAAVVTDRRVQPVATPLPTVPARLAETSSVAAALVRAGAPVASPAPPSGASGGRRRSRRRRSRAGHGEARPPAALAQYDRLHRQLQERERAAERAGRHLDQARRGYDRARTAEERATADAVLVAAAVRHERAQAVRRDLERQLAAVRATPGLARALAGRERRG